VLVIDNLNTHKPASLYDGFPPDKGRRLIDRLEIHYTPKHGSWLNIAETDGTPPTCCTDCQVTTTMSEQDSNASTHQSNAV
jgi:hypothetical protein